MFEDRELNAEPELNAGAVADNEDRDDNGDEPVAPNVRAAVPDGGQTEGREKRRPPRARRRDDDDDDDDDDRRTARAARKAKIVPSAAELITDDELDELGYSRDEYAVMAEMYESTLRSIDEGELVKGTVLAVDDMEVLVDIGFKSEGRIPIEEFPDPSELKPGAEISVLLEATEDQDGEVRVSKKKADFLQVWDKIKDAHDEQSIVEGIPKRRIKGGLKVDLFGVEAFLPGSQVALRRIPNLEELLGQKLRFRILKVNKRRRNIVVSRRVVLEEERQEKKESLLGNLEVGQIRQGEVKNITDFGAFVDLGGIDGLLHITDMSWGRIRHPSELVAIGDELTVKVLSFDPERERISLGLKQLAEYPWENVEEEFPVSTKVRGKVVSITDYGAFVELKEGVEGLIHISEMSWTQHIRHPSKILGIGDIVEVKVLNVNKADEKISLSLKRTESDPWQDLDTRYPVGTRIEGRVRNLTDFGAFVQLEEGMDGLVHISDMSWTKRIKHPSEILHRGQKVEVMVLGIDKDRHRISLGIKQCLENPWPQLAEQYTVGTQVEGKVARIHKSGVVVDLPDDVEGFVPMSHLALPEISRVEARFASGDIVPLEVIEVSPDNRRIVLSVRAYMEKQPEDVLKEYVAAHEVRPELLESAAEPSDDDGGNGPSDGPVEPEGEAEELAAEQADADDEGQVTEADASDDAPAADVEAPGEGDGPNQEPPQALGEGDEFPAEEPSIDDEIERKEVAE